MSNIKKGSKLTVSTANGISRASSNNLGVLEVSGPGLSNVVSQDSTFSLSSSNVPQFTIGATDNSGIFQLGLDNQGNAVLESTLNGSNKNILIQQLGGYVGIGTTNPASTLHVKSTDAIIIPVGTNTNRPGESGQITAQNGMIRYNTTTSQFEGYGPGSAWGSLGGVKDVDGDTYILAETSAGNDNDDLQFFTAGSQRMVILDSGNVGIGGTDNIGRLNIKGGGILLRQASVYTGSRPPAPTSSDTNAYDYEICSRYDNSKGFLRLIAGLDDNNSRIELSAHSGSVSHDTDRNIAFFTNNTEQMRINYQGRVGIGTNNPSGGKLHVVGDIYTTGKILGQVGGSNLIVGGTTYQNATAPTNGMLVEGNVGIGTTAPDEKLHIKGGNLKIERPHTEVPRIELIRNNSSKNFGGDVYQDWAIQNSGGQFQLISGHSTNGNTTVLSSDGAKVGIGTTSPYGKVEISDDWTNNGNAEAKAYLNFSNTNVTYPSRWQIGPWKNGSGSKVFGIRGGGSTTDFTALNSLFTVHYDGYVGINQETNLGMGTGFKLQVNGQGVFCNNGTKANSVSIGDNGIRAIIESRSTTHNLEFWVNGSSRLAIKADGNVGIGTTNPGYKLDVYGTIRSTSTIHATTFSGALSGNASTAGQVFVNDNSTGYDATNRILFTEAAGGTNANVRIDQALTYNPSSNLLTVGDITATNISCSNTIVGNASTATKIASITNNNIVQLTATQTLTNKTITGARITDYIYHKDNTTAETYCYFGFNNNDSFVVVTGNSTRFQVTDSYCYINTSVQMINYIYHTSNTTTYFGFPDDNAFKITINSGEAMRIDSTGNVGIGTDDPDYKLEVVGQVRATQGFSGGASSAFSGITNSGTITSTGSVGIGTTSAGTQLHVYGNQSVFLQGSTQPCIFHYKGASNGGTLKWVAGMNENPAENYSITGYNSAGHILLNPTGNVGIGTTTVSSSYKLHVNGNMYVQGNDFYSGTNHYYRGDINTRRYWDGNQMWWTCNANLSSYEMWLKNGKVGIGMTTTDPLVTDATYQLHLNGSSGGGLVCYRNNSLTGTLRMAVNSSQVFFGAFGSSTHRVSFMANGGEKMTIKADGNVGIGTTNPAVPLHIQSTDMTEGLRITRTNVTTTGSYGPYVMLHNEYWGGRSVWGNYDSNNIKFGVMSNNSLDIITNNTTRMYITHAGRVGIGTTSPQALLQLEPDTGYTNPRTTTNYGSAIHMIPKSNTDHTAITFSFSATDKNIMSAICANTSYGLEHIVNRGRHHYFYGSSSEVALPATTNNDLIMVMRGDNKRVGIGTNSPRCKLNTLVEIGAGDDEIPTYTTNINGNKTCDLFLGKSYDTQVNYWGMWMGTVYKNPYGSYIQSGSDDNHYPITLNPKGGRVGIGETAPEATFHLLSQVSNSMRLVVKYNNKYFQTNFHYGGHHIDVYYHGTTKTFQSTGNGGSMYLNYYSAGGVYLTGSAAVTSDDRLKHNEKKITNGLDIINQLEPKKYFKSLKRYDEDHNYDLDSSGNPITDDFYIVETGLIAQKVMTIDDLKYTVDEVEDKYKTVENEKLDENGDVILDSSGNPIIEKKEEISLKGRYTVKYQDIFIYNIAATKELYKHVVDLQKEITKVQTLQTDLSNANTIIQTHETTIQQQTTKITTLETQIADILTRLSNLENSN